MTLGQRVLWLLATLCYLAATAILITGLVITVRIASQPVNLSDLGRILQTLRLGALYETITASIHDAIFFASALVLVITVMISALFALIGWLFGTVRRLAKRVAMLEADHD